ncbi:MAG: GGDEF domain-containing protein [Lachnospiraceae bacterium]|nr:GGDEF domain-containing protein [Lachnospiraceae bacterium]
MNITENIKKTARRGISLRKMNLSMVVIACLISAVLFFAMHQTDMIYRQAHSSTQQLIDWRKSSFDLQLASDYLTEQMRCFAITGEIAYLNNYFEEAKVTKRRDRALAKLEEHHAETEALQNLQEAMNQSLELMRTEYYAARLAAEGYGLDLSLFPDEIRDLELPAEDLTLTDTEKIAKAGRLLFDSDYRAQKEYIYSHMQGCLDELEQELSANQLTEEERLEKQVFVEHILTFFLIAILLGIVFLTSRLVISPLRDCVELIRSDEDLPVRGAYEVRFLAKTYNLIHRNNLQSREKLTFEATHDVLTGLYNRRGYEYVLQNVDIENAALLLIDLDKFKQVNDTFGHDAGDKVLIRVSDAVFSSFRDQDYICRIGGDELAVIMVKSDPSLEKLIRRKIELINERLKWEEEGTPPATVSVGVAFGDDGMEAETLFKQADDALYEAKDQGRSNVIFYSEETEQKKRAD